MCRSGFTYEMDGLLACPECGHEWNPEEEPAGDVPFLVKDCNGNILQDGDAVVIIKNLPVKGSSQSIRPALKSKTSAWSTVTITLTARLTGSALWPSNRNL